jgi:glycosyltransferase involved in cell wall biosynthesis
MHINTEPTWRGGEAQVLLLARGMRGGAWPPVVVAQPGSPLAERARAADIPVEECALGSALDVGGMLRLRALVKRLRPALVHAHTSKAHSLAIPALLGLGVPLVVTRRVAFPIAKGLGGGWKYRAPAGWIAITPQVREVLVAGGIAAERIAVIPDAIDADALAAAPSGVLRRELGLPPEAVLVGCIAAFTAEKGHDTLLTAWQTVAAACPTAHLALIGDGPLQPGLRHRFAHLPRCHWLGFRADYAAVHRSLDLCVLASRHEGLGSSLLDALACGVPVVATRTGGIPMAVRDGEEGILVPVDDAPALAAAITGMVQDPERRARYGYAGMIRMPTDHGVTTIAAAHAATYASIAGIVLR